MLSPHLHVFFVSFVLLPIVVAKPPHIVFIVADDMGWNDIGYHNPRMVSPHLNRLARHGVILESTYVQPICTPSRASLMTGYFPIRLGLQISGIRPPSSKRLPDEVSTMPEVLKTRGYVTHMVGKWHLGFCDWKHTPTGRGFDSSFGPLYGSNDYYNPIVTAEFKPEFKASSYLTSGPLSLISSTLRVSGTVQRKGYDFRFNQTIYEEANGRYNTEVFAERAVSIIEKHDRKKPLFLYLAFKSPHGPLQAPKRYLGRCRKMESKARKIYCGMVAALDEAVSNVTRALRKAKLTKNLLLVFTSDNGGAVYAGGNNLPLRGAKTTLWEGGTRVPAFVYSPTLLKKRGYVHNGLFHAVDWLPTFAHVAGASPEAFPGVDGVNQWPMLSRGAPSRRNGFVYNFEEGNNGAIRHGDWKLISGKIGMFNRWYQVIGDHVTDTDMVNSTYLLFNIRTDPEERFNQFHLEPDVARAMMERMDGWQRLAVPPQPPLSHPRADPSLHGGVWTPGFC